MEEGGTGFLFAAYGLDFARTAVIGALHGDSHPSCYRKSCKIG